MSTTMGGFIDSISHHGIKGMRWGVRRSDAQLARARGSEPEPKNRAERRAADRAKSQSQSKAEAEKRLSDAELRRAVERMRLEQEYRRMTAEPKSKTWRDEGKEFAASLAVDMAKRSARTLAQRATDQQTDKIAKALGLPSGGKKKKKSKD